MVWSQGPVRVDRFSKQCSQPPRAEAETVHAEPQTGRCARLRTRGLVEAATSSPVLAYLGLDSR